MPAGHKFWHVCTRCLTKSKVLTIWLISQTITFPLEHLLWERVPLFADFTKWMGL